MNLRMTAPATCSDCGHTLVQFCPRCRGKVGGSQRTPAQQRTIDKALAARGFKRKPRRQRNGDGEAR